MKRLILALLAGVFVIGLHAESVTTTTIPIPKRCKDIFVPDTGAYAVFTIPKKMFSDPKLMAVSLVDGKKLWQKNYSGLPVKVCGRGIITNGNGLSGGHKLVDLDNGNGVRGISGDPVYVSVAEDVMICAKGNKLRCEVLSTGDRLWETKIKEKGDMDWNIVMKNDSTMIVQGDYLAKINVATGEVSAYPLVRIATGTTATQRSGIFPMFSVSYGGIGVGFAPGFGAIPVFGSSGPGVGLGFMMPTAPEPSVVGSKAVVGNDGLIYVADRKKLACLDADLNEKWTSPMPTASGSLSTVTLRGDTIDIFNSGYGKGVGGLNKVGHRFFSSVDRLTGKVFNVDFFPEEWNEKLFGKYPDFIKRDLFIYDEESGCFSPTSYQAGQVPLLSADGNFVIYVDKDMTVTDTYPSKTVFVKNFSLGDGSMVVSQVTRELPVFMRINSNGEFIERYPDNVVHAIGRDNHIYLFTADLKTGAEESDESDSSDTSDTSN